MNRIPVLGRIGSIALTVALFFGAIPVHAQAGTQLNVPGPQQVEAESTLTFTVTIQSEVPGLVLSMVTGPDGATFTLDDSQSRTNTLRGTFRWTPTPNQVGIHEALFAGGGSGGTQEESSVEITVDEKDVQPGNPPTLAVPPRVETIVGRELSFKVSAADPDGDEIGLAVVSEPLEGSLFTDNGDGTGIYRITPTLARENSTHTLVFSATGRRGEQPAHASVRLDIGFALSANPPRVDAPSVNRAATGIETKIIVETFDPDGGHNTLTLVSSGGLNAAVRPTVDPDHFVVAVRPKKNQAGQTFPVEVRATDETGRTTDTTFDVQVLSAQSSQTVDIEVRWVSIDPNDLFSEPIGVEVFEAPATSDQLTGDGADFLGYAIYASTDEEFEPSDETLVGYANPTWRNSVVTLTVPDAKRGRKPVTVRVSGRRKDGTGRPSKETSTDLPRFPSIPALLKGKLVLPVVGSNLQPGALVEIRTNPAETGERFALELNKKGTKYLVKPGALSTPGGVRFSDALQPGQLTVLILINQNGKVSVPVPFTP